MNIWRYIIVLQSLVFAVFGSGIMAAQVHITGVLPGAENTEIRLIKFSDRISFKTEILDRSLVTDSAVFNLYCQVDETMLVILDVDYYSALLYIAPGNTYKLRCTPVDIAGQYRPFYKKDRISYQLVDEPEPPINSLINDFESRYAAFVEKEMSGLYQKRNLSFLSAFQSQTDSLLATHASSFVKEYIRYRLADLKFILAPVKRTDFFIEYLDRQPVLYENPEYMAFFSSFFDHYLLQFSKFITRSDLHYTINNLGNYTALLDTLGKDTLLRNEVVRELALLYSVKQLYTDPSFNRTKLISVLDQMADRTKFAQHKSIAINLRRELTTLQPGTYAPNFKLPSLNGDTLGLTDFMDKPVYLSFFTTWSYACLAEFELMDSLYRQFGQQINFVTISLDKSFEIANRFRNEKNYEWTFLYNGSAYELIHRYRIKTFPFFVLIDRKGRIFEYPAYKPSEVIADRFRVVLKQTE